MTQEEQYIKITREYSSWAKDNVWNWPFNPYGIVYPFKTIMGAKREVW
jgi:hypothetical protein